MKSLISVSKLTGETFEEMYRRNGIAPCVVKVYAESQRKTDERPWAGRYVFMVRDC